MLGPTLETVNGDDDGFVFTRRDYLVKIERTFARVTKGRLSLKKLTTTTRSNVHCATEGEVDIIAPAKAQK